MYGAPETDSAPWFPDLPAPLPFSPCSHANSLRANLIRTLSGAFVTVPRSPCLLQKKETFVLWNLFTITRIVSFQQRGDRNQIHILLLGGKVRKMTHITGLCTSSKCALKSWDRGMLLRGGCCLRSYERSYSCCSLFLFAILQKQ